VPGRCGEGEEGKRDGIEIRTWKGLEGRRSGTGRDAGFFGEVWLNFRLESDIMLLCHGISVFFAILTSTFPRLNLT